MRDLQNRTRILIRERLAKRDVAYAEVRRRREHKGSTRLDNFAPAGQGERVGEADALDGRQREKDAFSQLHIMGEENLRTRHR